MYISGTKQHCSQTRRAPLYLAITSALTLMSVNSHAASNFTMLTAPGTLAFGTNNVTFAWNGSLNTNPATAVVNATLTPSSPHLVFGTPWTAYAVKVYGPGSYTISTADVVGGEGCPQSLQICAGDGTVLGGAPGTYNVTVNPGQIMAHMKFGWNTSEGIDVINVWQAGDWTVLNPTSPIFQGPSGTYRGPIYDLVSIDWNGDNIAGGPMIDGPFQGFNANFNIDGGSPGNSNLTQQFEAENPTIGGCSLASHSASLRTRGDWWLLGGFLAWLGVARARSKRQSQT